MKVKTVDPKAAQEFFSNKVDFFTGPVEVKSMLEKGFDINVIDVREEKDFQQGHIPNAVNLPKDKWTTFEGLLKDKNNILYCYTQTCHLAAKAGAIFAKAGYPVIEMEGGFKAWKENGFDIQK